MDGGLGQAADRQACHFLAATSHSRADRQDPSPGLLFQSYHSTRCTLGELVLQAHSHQLYHCHMDASLIRIVSKHRKANDALNKKK